MNTPEPMQPERLAQILAELERRAGNYRSSELAQEQSNAIDYYEAQPFGDEIDGRSQIVVPVVQEVVDYMTVSVLRTFVSGDRVVEFQPDSADQEDMAEEATETLNHVFMREQDGYKVLHDWTKAALVEKVCAVKTACITEEKRQRQTLDGLSEDDLTLLMQSGANVVQADVDDATGAITVVVEQVAQKKRYIDMPIPNYEFLFSSRIRHEDEADYLCHRSRKTLSELIEMGFPRDKVESLPGNDETTDIDRREQATWDDETFRVTDNDGIPGLREVMLREEYARIDWDGDGIAELICVHRVGKTILSAEEVEEQPFVVFCPFPRPHRMVGNSLADKVMDIQRQKSVLMRQTFDGIYMNTAPRWWLPQESTTEDTIDDILTIVPGQVVRGKGVPPVPLSQPSKVGEMLTAIEWITGEQESRTGITRLNQGLDADALNKTATGTALMQAQGQQMEEFVARNLAEAFGRLLEKKRRLMKRHGDPMMLRVDGEYREVNPSEWSDDMKIIVRVGLGSNSKDKRMAARMTVGQMMAEAKAAGSQIIQDKHIYNLIAGTVRDTQLGDPNDYALDPDSEEGQQALSQMAQKPDPEMAKAQDEMQRNHAQFQLDAQMRQMELEAKGQESAAKLDLMQQEAALKLQLEREKAEFEASQAQQQADREYQLALQQQDRDFELAKMAAEHKHELALKQTALPKNRPGGDLSK